MAYHVLERDRNGARLLASVLENAVTKVGHCRRCRTLCETETCSVCADLSRDQRQLCVVESPIDMSAILQSTHYQGCFFVLMGRLSPLDGIGPAELGLPQFSQYIQSTTINEIILATSATAEGQATAYYVAEIAHEYNIPTTRLAQGVPMGGELEFIDSSTLSHALNSRTQLQSSHSTRLTDGAADYQCE